MACDKLHNLRNVVADLRHGGLVTLERFTASPAQTRWYFEAVRKALGDELPPALTVKFDREPPSHQLLVHEVQPSWQAAAWPPAT